MPLFDIHLALAAPPADLAPLRDAIWADIRSHGAPTAEVDEYLWIIRNKPDDAERWRAFTEKLMRLREHPKLF